MKEFIEKIAKHQFHNGEWIDIQTDIDFSKYKPIWISSSLHIYEEIYNIDGEKYRLLVNYAIGSSGLTGGIVSVQMLKFDVEDNQYTFSPNKSSILHRSHQKIRYKKIYPGDGKITSGSPLVFDVIWSNDKSLSPASLLGFTTNSYKDFKYRLLPKQLGEKYQFIYKIN